MTCSSQNTTTEQHRGSGGVKAIGNYAPGMKPSKEAKALGYAEVIYLDAETHTDIEEVGAANFFCVKDNVLHTPELTGTILPGITRDSIIQLARHRGYEVVEGKIAADFAMAADEAFCCGTAAVISPIGSITHDGEKTVYGDGNQGTSPLSCTTRSRAFKTKPRKTSSVGCTAALTSQDDGPCSQQRNERSCSRKERCVLLFLRFGLLADQRCGGFDRDLADHACRLVRFTNKVVGPVHASLKREGIVHGTLRVARIEHAVGFNGVVWKRLTAPEEPTVSPSVMVT